MNPNGSQEINALANSLQGLRCWYVSCGGTTLPSFQLALGDKVLRQAPLRNPVHSEEFRNYEGEANLLVWCTWRLDSADRPVTSSDDTDESIVLGLERLLDCQVESIQVLPPAWDLTVQFSKGYCLRVFCDHVPGDPSFDGNWELWLRQVSVHVGPGERRVLESRDDEQVRSAAAG